MVVAVVVSDGGGGEGGGDGDGGEGGGGGDGGGGGEGGLAGRGLVWEWPAGALPPRLRK